MTLAVDVLREAAKRIGLAETPDGSNHVPGVTDWYGLDAAWCAMFVSLCLTEAGMATHYAWCSSLAAELERRGGAVVDAHDAQPGDVVFYEWGSTPGGFDHVGLVETPTLGGLITIEGNVGNAVRRLNRPWSSGFARIVRPAYDTPPQTPAGVPGDLLAFLDAAAHSTLTQGGNNDPAFVKLGQSLLNQKTGAGLAVDGDYGPKTTAAVARLQAGLNAWFHVPVLVVDGKLGPRTWWWLTR